MLKIRILIADDHPILRTGMRMLINSQPDMEVVDEAQDGIEAVEKAVASMPDVVIMDITMPNLDGIKATEKIIRNCKNTKVLGLTMHDNPTYLKMMLVAGASGYVVKKSVDSALLSAIRTIIKNRTFIDPSLSDILVSELNRENSKKDLSTLEKILSQREIQVLELVAQGYTNKEIGEKIFVSVKSVETYRSRIIQKLGLKNRADLVRYALEMGILSSQKLPPVEEN